MPAGAANSCGSRYHSPIETKPGLPMTCKIALIRRGESPRGLENRITGWVAVASKAKK